MMAWIDVFITLISFLLIAWLLLHKLIADRFSHGVYREISGKFTGNLRENDDTTPAHETHEMTEEVQVVRLTAMIARGVPRSKALLAAGYSGRHYKRGGQIYDWIVSVIGSDSLECDTDGCS